MAATVPGVRLSPLKVRHSGVAGPSAVSIKYLPGITKEGRMSWRTCRFHFHQIDFLHLKEKKKRKI